MGKCKSLAFGKKTYWRSQAAGISKLETVNKEKNKNKVITRIILLEAKI